MRRTLAIDVGIALAAFAATLALLSKGNGRGLDAPGVVLAAFATWPLVLHRRSPLGVFAFTAAASATMNGLDYTVGPPFGPTIALFFVASDERTRSRILPTAGVVIGFLLIHLIATGIAEGAFPLTPLLFAIVVWGGAWFVGDQVRQRRRRLADLEERAVRAEREAERERRLAAAEERTRIARDLHDSAGHAINVILVQAGAARLLQDRDPAAAQAALSTVEDVARETLGEIDQLVRALRDDGTDGGAGIEPPTGLDALETIAARHRVAGLDVKLEVRGLSRPLPPALDQAAYRILQEALTNAARHGLGNANVVVAFESDALELAVTNATRPVAPHTDGDGHGLVGMRERAALIGGTVETDQDNSVFSVRARLPYVKGEQ